MKRRNRRVHRISWGGIALIALLASSPTEPAADTLEEALGLYASSYPTDQADLREIAVRLQASDLDESLLAELLLRAHQYGADGAETALILRHAADVADRDLPSQPIFDRYLQGMSKGIDLDRIRTVAEKVEQRLGEAAEEIDTVFDRSGDPEQRRHRRIVVDHAAYAIGAGVSRETVHRTLRLAAEEDAPIEDAGSPLVTVGLLVSCGMDGEQSFEFVETGWKHGFRGEDLERLGREIGGLGSPGEGPPPEIVEQILDRIRQMEMHDRIFHELDNLHGRTGEVHHPPGSQPGDDPTQMHGPGGPPENPGHQDDHGHQGSGPGH